MKKLIAAAAFAATMAMAPANAGIIDFANDADVNGERGLASGSTIIIDGVTMVLSARQGLDLIKGGSTASPYLDATFNTRDAGLGVCKVLDGTQCDVRDDDNLNLGESVRIDFRTDDDSASASRSILGLAFKDSRHRTIGANNDGLVRIDADGGRTMTDYFSVFIAMAAGADTFFQNTSWIEFFFVDTDNGGKAFYVNALDVSEIPIPGALPLLLSGLAGLGFAGRRRKSKA